MKKEIVYLVHKITLEKNRGYLFGRTTHILSYGKGAEELGLHIKNSRP